MKTGCFTISLDFELFWGVRDVFSVKKYKENILGVYKCLPQMVELFKKYDIHVTIAPVGFLYFESKQMLLESLPSIKPNYVNKRLSPYADDFLERINIDDRLYFAPELIQLLKKYPNIEIATHTFSHYYCTEKGATIDSFEADLKCAIEISKKYGNSIKSIVFPRNQIRYDFVTILRKYGITSYRGNIHASDCKNSIIVRAIRFFDSYLNLTGYHIYKVNTQMKGGVLSIPGSRFLRPSSCNILNFFKLHRIKKEMYAAAMGGKIYHLWWHPHNFGKNTEQELAMLEEILKYYVDLRMKYGMLSLNMKEIAERIYK